MKKKVIAISAGHNPSGKIACGAVGYLDESLENRYIVREIMMNNKDKKKFEMWDCTIDNGKDQKDVLTRCVNKTNKQNADLNIQIHFNSSTNADANGIEILVHSNNQEARKIGKKILNKVCKSVNLKFRGIKERSDLYYLNHTKTTAIMIEVCFVTSAVDTDIYVDNHELIAKKIYKALEKYYYG